MAVSALDLRPRTALGVMDAALRLSSRDAGVWALTLPGAAAVTFAALSLVHVARLHGNLAASAAALTLAWCFRGLCQAASVAYVEALVLREPPTLAWAARAALRRLPSILVTTAMLGLYQILTVCSLGVLLLFIPGAAVAYGTAMRGRGAALAVLFTGGRLLGPSKSVAVKVRWLFAAQLLVLLNLQVGIMTLLYLGSELLGLDLAFARRFASFDHPSWMVALALVTFGLMEPLRATTSALLLVDARIRQEGLGLLARVQQLATKRPGVSTAAAAVLLLLVFAPTARAATHPKPHKTPRVAPAVRTVPAPGDPSAELLELADDCNLALPAFRRGLASAAGTPESRAALTEFLRFAERTTVKQGDCEALESRLRVLSSQMARAKGPVSPVEDPGARVASILARPEFFHAAEKAEPAAAPQTETAWDRFWRRVRRWLDRMFESKDRPEPAPQQSHGGAFARGLAWILIGVGVLVVAILILRSFQGTRGKVLPAALEIGSDPGARAAEDALSRPPDAWARAADLLALRGDFAKAVRNLYLALLARLHQQGAIDYVLTSSNWDYVQGFKGPSEQLVVLRELTVRFDGAIYGHLPVSETDYEEFKHLAKPVLVPSEEPPRA